eukprot:GILK01009398.1.p1 GENE.GILK01009398.1~~GILK01009398.1.p1  ORF type:complete len:233 (+),score=15.83 GILK01009398.1:22-720(+)
MVRETVPGAAPDGVPHLYYKTKMCPYYKSGQCTREADCNFAHSEEELRQAPDLKKTKLCPGFLRGACPNPAKCSFAHGEFELKATPDMYKTTMCVYWAQGGCKAGDRCRHAHGEQDLRVATVRPRPKYDRNLRAPPCGINDDLSHGMGSYWNAVEDVQAAEHFQLMSSMMPSTTIPHVLMPSPMDGVYYGFGPAMYLTPYTPYMPYPIYMEGPSYAPSPYPHSPAQHPLESS